jgi:hypothetical protein
MEVAPIARERQIAGIVRPVMLPGDDVFDMKSGLRHRSLRHQTIFAAILGPDPNTFTSGGVH